MGAKRKVGTRLGSGFVRLQRTLEGKGKEVIVSKSPTGLLSKSEAREVFNVLQVAKNKKLLPDMKYIYNPEPFPWAKDIMVVTPRIGAASVLAPKIRAVLKSRFGGKYKVSMG